ncbi:glycosyltransferase family 2 protein [Flavobacteriaceae bacterium S0862]|nr:glycosyltransferase family 2 protein [Flavobacteriaceae bacterium S0862]
MLHQNHLISIVLPCYNGENYLAFAIESCLNQSYKNFELIIVNDCSTDATQKIANQFAEKDERIIVINNETNKRLPVSLNIGHKQAKGNFITWTSDDNILKPKFLEILINSLLDNQVDVVYSDYDVIDEQGNFKRTHKTGPTEHILFGNKIGASFLYKKEVFNKLNGYDESLFLLEDYDFWIRTCIKFTLHHLDAVLYQYRLHKESLTVDIEYKSEVNSKHKSGALKMFEKIANELSWKPETHHFLTNHFLNESIDILEYLNNKKIIKDDVLMFNPTSFNEDELILGLNLLLRNHLLSDSCNRNPKTLNEVFKNEKQLLFHPSFSKKTTFNYILKSLF